MQVDPQALARLKANRHNLTWQQYRTLRGQIIAGDAAGAMRGLDNLKRSKTDDTKHHTKARKP